jgi:hypothetical protein
MVRRIAILVLATSAILLVARCGGWQLSTPQLKQSPPGQADQADLDNVALCFHEAVTVLQTEPDAPAELAVFMKKAKAAVDQSKRDVGDAEFHALSWNPDGTSLITQSGKQIRSRVANQTHNNYGPQGFEWLTEYEFYIPDTNRTSRTTIQLASRQ